MRFRVTIDGAEPEGNHSTDIDAQGHGGILPPGVEIERVYDRQELINLTTHTVMHNMVVGILLIFLLQWLFLGDLRSATIVAATIPFALSCAIGLMVLRGESANLLWVGAIDFGLIVDATVIMVERIFRQLAAAVKTSQIQPSASGLHGKYLAIFQAGTVVQKSILFAAAIIIAAFIPLFTLTGVEGHIFGPMAKTYAYALAGGLLATFTDSGTQRLSAARARPRNRDVYRTRPPQDLCAGLANRRRQPLRSGFRHGLAARICRHRGPIVGVEFMPKLEEGNLWIRGTLPATISLEEGNDYANRMRKLVGDFPRGPSSSCLSKGAPTTALMQQDSSTWSCSLR